MLRFSDTNSNILIIIQNLREVIQAEINLLPKNNRSRRQTYYDSTGYSKVVSMAIDSQPPAISPNSQLCSKILMNIHKMK